MRPPHCLTIMFLVLLLFAAGCNNNLDAATPSADTATATGSIGDAAAVDTTSLTTTAV